MSDPDDPADTSGAGAPERSGRGIDEPAGVDGCGGVGPDVDAAVETAVDAVPSDEEPDAPHPGSGWGGWGTDASI